MKYKLAIFDLDGTVLNTIEDLADSLNFALSKAGFPERRLDEVLKFVGNGIRNLICQAVPDGTDSEITDSVFADFKAYYREHCADKTKPYDGIVELLVRLRENGVKTAVISNKADFAVKILCEKYFPGLFEAVFGEREGVKRKPWPDAVNEVLSLLKTERRDAVYIGDSEVDIKTAENADMDGIIVSWGFRETSFLRESGAKRIVESPQEIYNIIVQKDAGES